MKAKIKHVKNVSDMNFEKHHKVRISATIRKDIHDKIKEITQKNIDNNINVNFSVVLDCMLLDYMQNHGIIKS